MRFYPLTEAKLSEIQQQLQAQKAAAAKNQSSHGAA
jgi:Na+/melibiose symporter-like transporter